MSYLVKPLNGESRTMELGHIKEGHRNGLIQDNWLVRHETQEFWLSVGKLLGNTKSQPVNFTCRHCKKPVAARMIDVDLVLPCPSCAGQVVVPDFERLARMHRDQTELSVQRTKRNYGMVLLVIGLILTVGSYMVRDRSRGLFVVFHGLLVAGFAMTSAHSWQVRSLARSIAETTAYQAKLAGKR